MSACDSLTDQIDTFRMDLDHTDSVDLEEDWLKTYFDDQCPVLNDRMITDACKPVSKRIEQAEHSYSLSCRTFSKDMDLDLMSDSSTNDGE